VLISTHASILDQRGNSSLPSLYCFRRDEEKIFCRETSRLAGKDLRGIAERGYHRLETNIAIHLDLKAARIDVIHIICSFIQVTSILVLDINLTTL